MPCGPFPVNDKIVLVTGGGSGIALAFVKLAHEQGSKGIIIADLKLTDEAQSLVDKEESIIFVKTDVTKRQELENLVKVSEDKFGNVPDVYVAGAGIFESGSQWWTDTKEDGYAILDVNVTHPLKLTRIAIHACLSKGKKGVILILSSMAGYQGNFGAPLYCATKHAVIGFVRSMAQLDELENIKVVAVAPGLVHTPLWTDHPAAMAQFGYTKEAAVMPEFVAEQMMEIVTKEDYPGGSCLQVSKDEVRTMGTWDIKPPKTAEIKPTKEVIAAALKPIRETLEKDKESQR